MNRQGLERELYVYIPESYSENSDPVPLLFSLHGYTSRAIWNLGYTGFQSLADQENFHCYISSRIDTKYNWPNSLECRWMDHC